MDKGTPFKYNLHVYGGTEYMGRGFEKRVASLLPKLDQYQCYMIPGPTKALTDIKKDGRPIIVWMHNTPSQFNVDVTLFLKHDIFKNMLRYIIVPSEFHKQETAKELELELDKILVIPNAIENYNYNPEKFNNPKEIKLIHTSSPDRGLVVLLEAVKKIDTDFRLEVYNTYDPDLNEFVYQDDRVFFYGRTPRDTVKDSTERSHIFAYPSTYPETFCLSLAESMAAGLLPLYSEYGSLMEVSGGHGIHYPFVEDENKHAEVFAEKLTQTIDLVKSGSWNPEEQIKYINNKYSWDVFKENWISLHNQL
jgi:glycosyltransferase involved in cell wall biosynthesis